MGMSRHLRFNCATSHVHIQLWRLQPRLSRFAEAQFRLEFPNSNSNRPHANQQKCGAPRLRLLSWYFFLAIYWYLQCFNMSTSWQCVHCLRGSEAAIKEPNCADAGA